MSQTWTTDSYASGHVGQTDLANMENNFAALRSTFAGTSAPSSPTQGQIWHDTTNDLLKIYTGSLWRVVWDIGNNRAPEDLVVTASILDSNVTTAKIAARNVTGAKIGLGASGVLNENIKDGTIELAKMATAFLIDHTQMANYAVTLFNSDVAYSAVATYTWETAYSFPLRFVTGKSDLVRAIFRIRNSLAGAHYTQARLKINGVYSGTEQTNSGTYALVETATGIDVSALNGAYLAEIQLYTASGLTSAYIIAASVLNYNS